MNVEDEDVHQQAGMTLEEIKELIEKKLVVPETIAEVFERAARLHEDAAAGNVAGSRSVRRD